MWEEALQAAAAIINGLGDKDRYCLYFAREQPEPLIAEPVGAKEQGLQLLKAATLKTTGSRLSSTIQAARAVLDREQKGRERELYVLTDGQAAAWAQPEDTAESSEDITQFVAVLGAPTPVNLTPTTLVMNPPLVVRDASARIKVRTSHTGPDRESTVTLFIDDEEIGRRPLHLGAGEEGEVEFTMPPRAPGVYSARVETPDDALQLDNDFHFLVRVRDQLPILCVGTEDDTLYLRTALKAALTGVEPARVDADAVADQPLHEMAAVFLCNALPLSGQALALLEQYVRSGGLLVMFPGERAAPGDYQPWTCLPGEGVSVSDLSPLERGRTLSWPAADHPLLRPFQRGLAPPQLTVRRSLSWERLADDAQSLISQAPGQPFLLERSVGEGKVLMFAITADRTWSSFPLSPFFLPLLAQMVDYGAGVGVGAPFLWTTESLPLTQAVPGANRDTVLLDPEARRLPVSSAVVDGVTQLRVEGLTLPGVYTLAEQGPALAMNMTREESDLTPLRERDLARLLKTDDLIVATNAEQLQLLIEEHRVGRTYGEHLLWVALLLVGIEYVYANRLARSGSVLSEQLGVEPSGRVKRHPEVVS